MTPNQLIITVEKRKNTFAPKGVEWALTAQFIEGERWTLRTWTREPTPEQIGKAKDLVLRSMEVYHRHLSIPKFNLKIIEP